MYYNKYLKYKAKYLKLLGGNNDVNIINKNVPVLSNINHTNILNSVIGICSSIKLSILEKHNIASNMDIPIVLLNINKLLNKFLKDTPYNLQLHFMPKNKIPNNSECYIIRNKLNTEVKYIESSDAMLEQKEDASIIIKAPIELCDETDGVWEFTYKGMMSRIVIKGLGNPKRVIQQGYTHNEHQESLLHHMYMQLLLWDKIFNILRTSDLDIFKANYKHIVSIPIALVLSDSTKCGDSFKISDTNMPSANAHGETMAKIFRDILLNYSSPDSTSYLIMFLIKFHMLFHVAKQSNIFHDIANGKKNINYIQEYIALSDNKAYDYSDMMLNLYSVIFEYCDSNGRVSFNEINKYKIIYPWFDENNNF